jgi:peptidoglycan/xylan/chitin deacetylase (PgdA/CDA1 family)
MSGFAILMYHRVVSPDCPIPGNDREEARYAVSLSEFEWQLKRLKDVGLEGVSVRLAHETLAAGYPVPSNQVVLTFDDGNRSDFEHARPLLGELGFSATFFVATGRVGVEGGLEPDMLRAMVGDGLDVGSHGMTHRFLTGLSAEEEEEELRRSKEVLEDLTGAGVEYFAPPGGRIGQRGVAALKRLRYRAVCTSEFGLNDRDKFRFAYKRIPVVASTSRSRFDDFLSGSAARLFPLYVRNGVLRVARGVLGEKWYGKLRSKGVKG